MGDRDPSLWKLESPYGSSVLRPADRVPACHGPTDLGRRTSVRHPSLSFAAERGGCEPANIRGPWTTDGLGMVTDTMAHWIERLTSRPRVPGSIPGGAVDHPHHPESQYSQLSTIHTIQIPNFPDCRPSAPSRIPIFLIVDHPHHPESQFFWCRPSAPARIPIFLMVDHPHHPADRSGTYGNPRTSFPIRMVPSHRMEARGHASRLILPSLGGHHAP